MIMPGRQFNPENYRFGFNGKENDNEVKGVGNQQDYGMRVYDGRIARFLSIDPLSSSFPELTTFQFSSNSPISNIDLDGLERYYFQRKFDEQTGISEITILRVEDIVEKTYSIEMQPSAFGFNLPGIVYTSHKNERQEYITNVKEDLPLESVYGLNWYPFDVTYTYTSEENAINNVGGVMSGMTEYRILQGLNYVAEEVRESGGPNARSNHSGDAPTPNVAYSRKTHYPNTPTKADRRFFSATSEDVVDHNPSLVRRYYLGDPNIKEKPGFMMTPLERKASAADRTRMKIQPRRESNQQGGYESNWSRTIKKKYGLQ